MKKITFVCILSIFLSACFSGRSPDPKFYLFDVLASNKESDKNISILFEKIKVPALVDKPQIVLKEKDSLEVSVSEFNRWSEPLPNMIRQTLISDLNEYLPNAFIKPDNYDTSGNFDYTLLVEVETFIGEKNYFATFSCWWTLKDKNGKIIRRKKSNFENFMDSTYESYVDSQSYNIDELAMEIANFISEK